MGTCIYSFPEFSVIHRGRTRIDAGCVRKQPWTLDEVCWSVMKEIVCMAPSGFAVAMWNPTFPDGSVWESEFQSIRGC
jgi:hypothetical protein